MNHVIIDGIPPWDGRYGFDDFALTHLELYEIRKISELRASELIEALDANDSAAYVAFAYVILDRHGHKVDVRDLWAAKVGSIKIELGEVDAGPPTTSVEPDAQNASGSGSGGDGEPGGA